MRLGIDLDGVVANFTQGWIDFYNRQFGTSLDVDDCKRWNDLVGLTHFYDIDEFWEWSSDLDSHSIFWHLEPFPGAVEAVRGLVDAGHTIIVLTTKPDFAVNDTHDWLERHHFPAAEVHILEDKWTIDCDVYLDDGPHVLEDLVAHRPDRTVCRYVRPWNHPLEGAIDVRDFDAFRLVVDAVANDSLLLE